MTTKTSLFDGLPTRIPILTDGGWGTRLQALGLPLGEYSYAWNVTHPDLVEEVARSYVEAGSQVLLTNTFGANRITLEGKGPKFSAADLNAKGAALSLKAAGNAACVFGSIGPTDKRFVSIQPTPREIYQAFREQAFALAGAGVHGLVLETMTDLDEALLAIEAAKETQLPVIACMLFDAWEDSGPADAKTLTERAVKKLSSAGVAALGANCGNDPKAMLPHCRRLKEWTGLPLWLKPNAGHPIWEANTPTYRMPPEEFVTDALALVDAGASFIGGCCGTGPEHIRALSLALKNRER